MSSSMQKPHITPDLDALQREAQIAGLGRPVTELVFRLNAAISDLRAELAAVKQSLTTGDLISREAMDAREVFSGSCSAAGEAIDYLEQRMLAALPSQQAGEVEAAARRLLAYDLDRFEADIGRECRPRDLPIEWRKLQAALDRATAQQAQDDDDHCTCCHGTGITLMTERPCACADGDAHRPMPSQQAQGEPVAWQSRARQCMEGDCTEWSKCREGKSPKPIPFYWEVEERPLYAGPATAQQGGV